MGNFYRYYFSRLKNLTVILGLSLYLGGCGASQANRVCFKTKCFQVELAATSETQTQGLMFREHLPPNEGMLFLFAKEARYGFWMKNTYIPLDIIWIDQNKKVVFIKENARPCQQDDCLIMRPPAKARYALEVNAGAAKDTGLDIGDQLEFFIK